MDIKKLCKFGLIFLIYFISSLVYLIPLSLLNIDYTKLGAVTKCLLMLSADLFVSILLFFIYKDYLIEKFKDFKKNFGKYSDISIKSWLFGIGFMCMANYILYLFSPAKESLNEIAVQNYISKAPLLMFLLTTFLAPFIEEMIFRKSIKDCFTNNSIFILFSALLFGYLHVSSSTTIYDFLYIIPYGALGASFAYVLVKTDNIYSTILLHLIHNGLLTLISIFL